MPDQEEPKPPQNQPDEAPPMQATPLEDEEYQTIADEWMDAINEQAEAMQEAREEVEVEYSVRSSSCCLDLGAHWRPHERRVVR